MPSISVIVPTLNRSDEIRDFVDTLKAQTHTPDELVVVDAGAPSQLEEELRLQLQDSSIALVYARSIAGTSLQRNVAISQAKGDIFFFFDDDILLEPDYIEKTLPCFDIACSPPVGGVLGTFTSPYQNSWQKNLFFRLFRISYTTAGDHAKIMSSGAIRWLIKPSQPVQVPVCSGGRVAFRKECFMNELWDDFLPGYTMGEDVEISRRIGKKWSFIQTPDALLFHEKSPNSRNARADRIARRIFSHYYIVQKNHPRTIRNMLGFAWWNIGIVFLYTSTGIKDDHEDIKGIKRGYSLCWKHLKKKLL